MVAPDIRFAVLDYAGYPTDEALEWIAKAADPNAALDMVEHAWHPVYGSAVHYLSPAESEVVHESSGDRFLRLATGGWSGCEDVLEALHENTLAWACTWRLSTHGGLHVFQYLPFQVPS